MFSSSLSLLFPLRLPPPSPSHSLLLPLPPPSSFPFLSLLFPLPLPLSPSPPLLLSARYTEGSEVDVRSCVLSLIDLFTHWLTQPIHTLLLQHMLRAVLMVSDLFAMVSSSPYGALYIVLALSSSSSSSSSS